jgi:hypothetical protein
MHVVWFPSRKPIWVASPLPYGKGCKLFEGFQTLDSSNIEYSWHLAGLHSSHRQYNSIRSSTLGITSSFLLSRSQQILAPPILCMSFPSNIVLSTCAPFPPHGLSLPLYYVVDLVLPSCEKLYELYSDFPSPSLVHLHDLNPH